MREASERARNRNEWRMIVIRVVKKTVFFHFVFFSGKKHFFRVFFVFFGFFPCIRFLHF